MQSSVEVASAMPSRSQSFSGGAPPFLVPLRPLFLFLPSCSLVVASQVSPVYSKTMRVTLPSHGSPALGDVGGMQQVLSISMPQSDSIGPTQEPGASRAIGPLMPTTLSATPPGARGEQRKSLVLDCPPRKRRGAEFPGHDVLDRVDEDPSRRDSRARDEARGRHIGGGTRDLDLEFGNRKDDRRIGGQQRVPADVRDRIEVGVFSHRTHSG